MNKALFVKILTVLVAALLLAVAGQGQAASFYVYGWVYSAMPVQEGVEHPPSVLPSPLPTGVRLVGNNLLATGLLAMTKVDVIDNSSDTVIASGLARMGAFYTSFSYSGGSRQVRLMVSDAATGTVFVETESLTVSSGGNELYLLVPGNPLEVGGTVTYASTPNHYAFTRVGLVEVADIGSDGLADYNSLAQQWQDAPFGRTLKIFGATNLYYYPPFGSYCYRIKVDPDVGSPFYITDPLYKRRYVVDSTGGTVTVSSTEEKVGPFPVSGIQCYDFTPVSSSGSGTSTIFWSFPDQLANWSTLGIADGSHELTLEVFNMAGTNQGTAGPPLTLEINNKAVDLSFDMIEQRSSTNTTQVDLLAFPCDIVNLTGGRKLFIEFTAHHPDGFLASYHLQGKANSATGWSSWASGTYTAGSFSGVNPGSVNMTSSSPELSAGTCAYNVYLHAWARTTNGYHRLFHPHKLKAYYIQTP